MTQQKSTETRIKRSTNLPYWNSGVPQPPLQPCRTRVRSPLLWREGHSRLGVPQPRHDSLRCPLEASHPSQSLQPVCSLLPSTMHWQTGENATSMPPRSRSGGRRIVENRFEPQRNRFVRSTAASRRPRRWLRPSGED